MLEEGEIDEEVSSSVSASGATASTRTNNNNNPKKSPPKSGDNMNHQYKRSKHSDDSYHAADHSSNSYSNGYADWDDRIVAAVPRPATNGASTANSLMSIPMSSLKLVSKTLKDHEPAEPTSSSSGWLSPPKREPENAERNRSGPPSIFDLITSSTLGLGQSHQTATAASHDKLMNFLNFDSNQMQSNKSSFVDPVITEKENKPKARNQGNSNGSGGGSGQQSDSAGHKRKFSKGPAGSSGPTFEISDKKAEKKRKYFDEHKKDSDRQKSFVPREREPIVCKFYLEGRCQKGDECPFSHNAQVNKRLEICKYYLNGFCAKKDQCLYMHSEFPCKFYHRVNRETGQRRSDCLHGSQCRFSHEPIKNPMLKEAFEKYLAECDEAAGKGSGGKFSSDHHSSAAAAASNIPSLMTLPLAPAPAAAAASAAAIGVNTKSSTGQRPLGSPNAPSSPPPLQTPLPLLSTSIMSLDRMTAASLASSKNAAPARFQDVDERDVLLKPVSSSVATALLGSTGDIDERAIPASVVLVPAAAPQLNLNSILATVKETASSYNADKEKLIGLVMKAIADDGSVFSQIPKQTLSELLLKLLQNKPDSQLGHDTIKTLLATFTSVTNPAGPAKSSASDDSSHQLRRKSTYSDYDDEDEDEGNLVIEGNVGEIPYKIYEIDVEPSSLWANPPSTSMTSLLAASLGNEDAIDQESDPRIKYYANKANLMNVANFQLQSQQQQQLLTPNSPSHASQSPSSSTTISAVGTNGGSLADLVKQTAQAKTAAAATVPASTARVDPRLARSMNQATNAASASPTRPLSPQSNGTDLSEAIQNLASSSSSNNLLASLPDFQLPKIDQMQRNNGQTSAFSSLLSASAQQSTNHSSSSDTSTVKLSIEDYKRKLQKPNGQSNGLTTLGSSSSNNNLSSLAAALNSSSTNQVPTPAAVSNSPTIPGMPSMYSLQAPQSLHELLRNFQS